MSNQNTITNKDKSEIYVIAIQILFAIIIGISFTDYHKELVPATLNFETAMIIVAYTTVLVSLVGYSIGIKKRYHKNVIRFILDVILLYLYFQLVYSPTDSFSYFLKIFPIIFFIYAIWQYLEYREWRNDESAKYDKKRFVRTIICTIVITIIFTGLACLYSGIDEAQNIAKMGEKINYWPISYAEIIILLVVFTLVVFFRFYLWKLRG